MTRGTLLPGMAGLAFGLGLALVAGALARGGERRPDRALVEELHARNERLSALARQQRQAADTARMTQRQIPSSPATSGRDGVAPARPAAAPVDPAVAAEDRTRLDRAREVLRAALGAGRWTDESRAQFREQLAAMSGDQVRQEVVHELIVAINRQKLRLEGQQLELF